MDFSREDGDLRILRHNGLIGTPSPRDPSPRDPTQADNIPSAEVAFFPTLYIVLGELPSLLTRQISS